MHRKWFTVLLLCLVWCTGALGQALAPEGEIEGIRELTYRTIAGKALALDVFRPATQEAPVPVILVIHGGPWLSGERGTIYPLAHRLAAAGYAVVTPDYRLAPEYVFPAPLDDLRAAAHWVREHAETYHFNLHRFFVLGVSAGGQLADLLALQPAPGAPPARGLITLAAPTDFTVRLPSLKAAVALQLYLGADRDEHPDRYRAASPITYVSPTSPPSLIMHGADDPFVPPAQSTALAAALRAKQISVILRIFPGMGHEMPSLNSPAGQQIVSSILLFLASDGTPVEP